MAPLIKDDSRDLNAGAGQHAVRRALIPVRAASAIPATEVVQTVQIPQDPPEQSITRFGPSGGFFRVTIEEMVYQPERSGEYRR